MTFVVRRVRPSEGALLRALRLRALADAPSAFASTYAAEVAHGDDHWEAAARRRAAGHEEATFVAESERGFVGIAGAFVELDPRLVHLVSLWTAPEERRRGVATALVEAVRTWARACGAEEVHIWATCGNDAAEAFYRALGFVPTGDHQPLPSDPTRTEQRMRLRLG